MKDVNAGRAAMPMIFMVDSMSDLPQSLASLIARFPKDYSAEVRV